MLTSAAGPALSGLLPSCVEAHPRVQPLRGAVRRRLVGWRLDHVLELWVHHSAAVFFERLEVRGAGKLPHSIGVEGEGAKFALLVVLLGEPPVLLRNNEERVVRVAPIGAVREDVVLCVAGSSHCNTMTTSIRGKTDDEGDGIIKRMEVDKVM